MTIYQQGQPLPNHESCDDCVNPMWCRINRTCQGVRHVPQADIDSAELAQFIEQAKQHGIVEMLEAAPNGQLAFSGTPAQWLAFLREVEEYYI